MEFSVFSTTYKDAFEEYLLSHIEEVSNTDLEAAMNYSLEAKGKRLRPLLLLGVLESFGISVESGYPAAAALEMIHTYSLIHDDLPAMDDDDLRRGKPTNHIQFNEATAILAGDALLTLAFEVITQGDIASDKKVALVQLLSETAGYKGMVGGQQADIDGENSTLSLKEIEAIHTRKTGALIKMATVGGGIIAGANEEVKSHLSDVAEDLGIAYQIRDDILEVVATEEELGKAVDSDEKLGKSTYPSLLGLKGAYEQLDKRLDNATTSVERISEVNKDFNSKLLKSFVQQLSLEEYN
jgi:geranylgeranyl diphosphate synthase type II